MRVWTLILKPSGCSSVLLGPSGVFWDILSAAGGFLANYGPSGPILVLGGWSNEDSLLVLKKMYSPKLQIAPNMGQLLVYDIIYHLFWYFYFFMCICICMCTCIIHAYIYIYIYICIYFFYIYIYIYIYIYTYIGNVKKEYIKCTSAASPWGLLDACATKASALVAHLKPVAWLRNQRQWVGCAAPPHDMSDGGDPMLFTR